ncbi:MAG: hypothetical protein WKG06_41825 [Segetibacter sp.]
MCLAVPINAVTTRDKKGDKPASDKKDDKENNNDNNSQIILR